MSPGKKKVEDNEEAVHLLRKAGYYRLTPLQRKAIPLILKGNDLVIETESGEGKTASYLIPILIRLSHARGSCTGLDGPAAPSALVITSSYTIAARAGRQFIRLTRKNGRSLSMVSLGKQSAQRHETDLLAAGADLVVGTPERIIDHVARNSLDLSRTDILIIDMPCTDNPPAFIKDVQYILTKTGRRRQSILITPALNRFSSELSTRLKSPVTLDRESWSTLLIEHVAMVIPSQDNEYDGMADMIESGGYRHTVIFTANQERADTLRRYLRKRKITCRYLSDSARISVKNKTLSYFNTGRLDIIILIHASHFFEKMRYVENVIYFDLPKNPIEYGRAELYLQDSEELCRVYAVVREQERGLLEKIQEKLNVKMKQAELPTEEEVLKGTFQSIVKRIRDEENPEELQRYRKLIRQNVPFLLRGYFAAYLFKEAQQKKGRMRKGNVTTLFVGIGKNRKIFPKDLSQLFLDTLGISRTDLGEIKVLDNYSFVDIASEHAQKAIDGLNGTQLRGRHIIVNFARKKEETGEQS